MVCRNTTYLRPRPADLHKQANVPIIGHLLSRAESKNPKPVECHVVSLVLVSSPVKWE